MVPILWRVDGLLGLLGLLGLFLVSLVMLDMPMVSVQGCLVRPCCAHVRPFLCVTWCLSMFGWFIDDSMELIAHIFVCHFRFDYFGMVKN